MPSLFLSHSSKDDAAAVTLEAWLTNNGFTDIFVDHRMAGGDKWRDELRASAASCRVVVCLVSRSWLKSDECFGEFMAAVYLGRRIIPLFLPPPPEIDEEAAAPQKLDETAANRLVKVGSEDQGIKLDTCVTPDGVLDIDSDQSVADRLRAGLRAAGALNKVGLDPEAFSIDRRRIPTPFPGLASFGDDDAYAALFYGRSREIALVLDELRRMRATRDLRPFVILGASGAGKSSLLKAGVIPRLRRERPAWLPLRALRPGADPLLNFADALVRTLADFGKVEAPGVIRDRLFESWSSAERDEKFELTDEGKKTLEEVLEVEGRKLRTAMGHANATILISVDQAEEIARFDGKSGDALGDYLRIAQAARKSDWMLAFTIRTDSFPELQAHHRFQGLEVHPFDLRAMPTYYHDSVVEEPVRRYGHEIEQSLLEALMKDIPDADALPLLAFTLQRLWQQFASSGNLTKQNYEKLGGLKGLMEDAAERALRGIKPDQDVPLFPREPSKQIVELGVYTFVPTLVQINEQGATIRRVAKWSSFTSEQQDLLHMFDLWRLVVLKGEADGNTVEVAHEALFREWTRLKGWLEPERARLDALRLLQIDASNWKRNDRDAGYLNHRGNRLTATNALTQVEGYRKYLATTELEYLAACKEAEKFGKKRARRVWMLVGLLFGILVAGPAAYWQGSWLKEKIYWLRHVHVANAGDLQFQDCTDCPEMIAVPAGTFMMGARPAEGERAEFPQHEVAITQSFAVGKTEVTFDQWEACVTYGDCRGDIGTNGWGRGQQPVINITWSDAKRYVNWLSRVTGQTYRLLTEAEWEYVARAGNQALYSFGNDDEGMLKDFAWFEGNAEGHTHPVKGKRANQFGLNDVYGNVSEWVEDCYAQDYRNAHPDGSAWTAQNCGRRVVRGGSFQDRARALRSSARDWSAFDKGEKYIGFRVARTLVP
jgi:formylglycine-generating enzyme required for sulfatase activity